MSTLPYNTRQRPMVRALWRKWTQATDGTGGWSVWQVLPMAQQYAGRHWSTGFYVDFWSRYCMPLLGEARLRFRRGRVNGYNYTDIPDLRLCEIRIQAAPPPAFEAARETIRNFVPVWRTVWWGTCENIETGATDGEITYHCFDGFYRAKRWQMVRHGSYYAGDGPRIGRGHPGYNLAVDGFYARIQGNRDSSNATFDLFGDITTSGITNRCYCHTWPALSPSTLNDSAKWTDQQAIEHAVQSSRGLGDPVFELRGAVALFSGTSSWPVHPGQICWDFVATVTNRRRGRGLVYVDWEDDYLDPIGNLNVCLRARTPFPDDLVYTPPGSSPLNIPGATTAGSAIVLDYSGDHRLVPGSVSLSDPTSARFDYVESMGEPIEALVTLSGEDLSLEPRWSAVDETAFNALTSTKAKATSRWDPIYQRYGLPQKWNWIAKNGNSGTDAPAQVQRCDYYCDLDGSILVPGVSPNADKNPPSLLLSFMSADLPLYEGWNYNASTPARWDAGGDLAAPPRRRMMALGRTNGNNYLDLSRIGFSLTIDPAAGVLITFGPYQDEAVSGRFFSKAGVVGFSLPYQSFCITVNLHLADRVRMGSGNELSQKRLYITHPGLHLWLAHPGAIWDLDRSASAVSEAPALRAAAPNNNPGPGVLRDDRAALAQLHALACVWYLRDHRTFSLSLRDCVALPSFTDINGTVINNPTLGALVTSLTYTNVARATESIAVNTPITGYYFDNVRCQSNISTDWADLDFVSR